MARIPTRFYGPAQLSNSAATKYTVSAAEKIVLRHVHVYNPGSGSVNVTLSIGADAAGTRVLDAFPVAEDDPLDLFCYYVLDATEIIQAFASVGSQAVMILDGDRIVVG